MVQKPNTVYDPNSDEKGIPSTGSDIASGNASHPLAEGSKTTKKRGFGFSSKSSQPKQGFGASSSTEKSSYTKSDLSKAENEGGLFTSTEEENSRWGFRKRITRRRAAAAGGIAGGSIFVAVLFSSVSQGPLQFVHMSQLLQQFHFTSNEDFGDDRTAKYLFYAMAGNAENGRLGVGGNFVANKYEANLKERGIHPVYSKSRTGQLQGFAFDDKAAAEAHLRDIGGKGEVVQVKDKPNVKGSKKFADLPGNAYMVDISNENLRTSKLAVRSVMKQTGVLKISGSVGSRLLIKRGGVTYHALNYVTKKAEQSDKDWIKKGLKKDAEETKNGSQPSKSKTRTTNADGEPVDSENGEYTDMANEAESELPNQIDTGESTIDIFKKTIVKAGGGAVLTVGLLCTAQDYGDSVADYKYTNSALPMMRMGMKAITMGSQVSSNDDVSTDALMPYAYRMHDDKAPKGQQSWTDAKSIQAELGQKQTGPDLPEEARLGNVNDKPAFFDLVNKIPGLSGVCSVQDTFQNLPIIKQVSDATSQAIVAAANVPLKQAGTSVEDLAARALSMIAGNTVNPYAKGAEYGNLANVGAFMGANDQARTMGGVPLSDQDVAALKIEINEDVRVENSNKSIAQRYLNIRDPNSFIGAAADKAPSTPTSVASVVTNIGSVFSGSVSKVFALTLPNAKAATSGFNYGVPKYGFSLSERDDPEFDDPYANANIIESSGKLDELNEKYGKTCFGMTITENATVESNDQGGDGVNLFKVMDEHPECNPKNNSDPWFLRYRFYLADASTNTSMTCYFGNDGSCTALGFQNSSDTESGSGSEQPEAAIDMEHLYESSVNIACADGTNDLGVQDGYHDGKKVKIRVCGLPSVPETGETSDIQGADGKLLVNSRLSAFYVALIKDARAAGVSGITAQEGFRTMQRQIDLKAQYGDGAATPGYSNHQMGLAVDWGDSMIAYLQEKPHGLKALVSGEDWHWSPTGY